VLKYRFDAGCGAATAHHHCCCCLVLHETIGPTRHAMGPHVGSPTLTRGFSSAATCPKRQGPMMHTIIATVRIIDRRVTMILPSYRLSSVGSADRGTARSTPAPRCVARAGLYGTAGKRRLGICRRTGYGHPVLRIPLTWNYAAVSPLQ
jgi:hypothetical protein